MRSQLRYPDPAGRVLHNAPDSLTVDSFWRCLPRSADTSKHPAVHDASRCQPVIELPPYPIRNGNGPDMTSFTHHIDYRPVLLPPLEVVHSQGHYLVSTQPTGQQQTKH